MQAIGERLREARMRQGLDISELEASTKIRAKYLRALENDEFAMLPGTTYVRSFLRTYAEYLGLDAQLLVEEFRAQHEPREVEAHALAPPARAARPGRERRGPGAQVAIGPGTLAVGAILLVLVLLAVIGLASGGDGPTADDLTMERVARFAGRELVLDARLEARIAEILKPLMARWRGLDPDAILASNRKQAMTPAGARPLDPVGTAPGAVVPPANGRGPAVVVLPGPPRELHEMWRAAVATQEFGAAA